MKLLFGLLVLIPISTLFAAEAEKEDHANFQKVDCPADVSANMCLHVDFPSDKTDDLALLHYVNGEVTVLSGHLMEEKEQMISVTLYEDHMEITLHSIHDDGHSVFNVDLESGLTTILTLPKDGTFDRAMIAPDEINNATEAGQRRARQYGAVIPANGYALRVAVFYDNKFLYNLNGGSTSAAETRITSIFTHVSTIFSKLTVSGVSGAIVPSVVRKTHISQSWSVSQHLSYCSWTYSNALQLDVDVHAFLTTTSIPGVLGVAWVRSTCSIYQYYRSNINGWVTSDTITAQIVAHEIGHNLGMFHDFIDPNPSANRYLNGQTCTGIGGYMDYTLSPTQWSQCSVYDFSDYHQAVNQYGPNDGVRRARPFCLEESTTGGGNTCVETCTNNWTGATPSCITADIKASACTTACAASGATCS